MPLTLPASWPAADASSTAAIPARWSALGEDEDALPPHIHLLSLSEPAFPISSSSSAMVATLQLQHLLPASDGGEPTPLSLDLGRLLGRASILSVEARTITGAFPAGEDVECSEGGSYVRVRLPPGGFCTLEVAVGVSEKEGGPVQLPAH